jgi:hypothetical protein
MVILTNYSYDQMVTRNLAGKLYYGGATLVKLPVDAHTHVERY